MNRIDKKLAQILFERIEEIIENTNLTPKERIPKYRSILDDLFKALTVDAKKLLSNLSARSIYIFREHNTPYSIQKLSNGLRIFANKVVHETDLLPSSIDDQRCAYQLAEILTFFSKTPIPEPVISFYKDSLDEIKKEIHIKKEKRATYDFYGVIEEITFPEGQLKGKLCKILCHTDMHGTINLKLWNNKNERDFGSDLTVFGKMAEPYQNFYVTNVLQDKDKENEFSATDRSYIVLEPDYLIDAKELSECRQFNPRIFGSYLDNSLLFILSRFTKGEVTDRIMVGNIVGKVLDDIVTEKEYDYKKSFESVMRDNSFGMLCIANENGNYESNKIKATYIEAEAHELKLREVLKTYKGKQIILEPTFISSKFGLQGRLDILVDYGKESVRKDIVELKSSKKYPSANIGLYHNHEAQALCYDLLVSSTYPERIGDSSILYSNALLEEKPLRNVAEEKFMVKQDLLMLRNRIVASELKLAKGNFEPFLEILDEAFGPYPRFLEDQVNEFRSVIKNLDSTLKEYFFGFLQFIYYELQVAKIGSNDPYGKSNGYADLWRASRSEKISNYDALIQLKVKEVSDNFHVTLQFDRDLFSANVTVSSFRVGDTAVIYPTPDSEELNPLKSQILKCRVLEVDFDSIKVSLVNKQLDKSYFNSSIYWALERDFREIGYKQLLQQLYEFVKSERHVIDLVLGLKKPEFEDSMDVDPAGMNPVQYENVRNAVRAKDYYLIQGPPGTGKTSKVLVEIARNLSQKETAIMVVAFTNRAVDEVCEKLVELNIKCIRLGKGEKPYYWSALSGSLKLNELNDEVQKTNVFVSTLSTFAGSLDILKLKNFETLIVDEASQVLEPQLTGFLKYFKKWILIGDENQLPAVVLQNESESRTSSQLLQNLSLLNFRESLFYRLKKNAIKNQWNDCYGELKYHYRMHSDIAEFPNKYFYENKLEEKKLAQKEPIADYSKFKDYPLTKVFSTSRVAFIPSRVDKRSKINNEEAKLVAALLQHIAIIEGDKFEPAKSVGVITPFRAQIANIRNHLNGKFKDVTIDTVERFQGSERKIIIVSFAVKSTNQLGAIQSINDEGVDRKLNVAMTRAKDHLILIGSEQVLEKNEIMRNLIII